MTTDLSFVGATFSSSSVSSSSFFEFFSTSSLGITIALVDITATSVDIVVSSSFFSSITSNSDDVNIGGNALVDKLFSIFAVVVVPVIVVSGTAGNTDVFASTGFNITFLLFEIVFLVFGGVVVFLPLLPNI